MRCIQQSAFCAPRLALTQDSVPYSIVRGQLSDMEGGGILEFPMWHVQGVQDERWPNFVQHARHIFVLVILPFNPRLCTASFITRTCWGGGRSTTHMRFETKRRRAQRKTTSQLLSMNSRNWWCVFWPRVLDTVMRGQKSNFREIETFSTLQTHISKTVNRSDIRLSPACSSFHFEQN